MPHRLDAAATLAFQTPLQEHPPAADGKAGALLTMIGLMFSLLAGQAVLIIRIVEDGGIEKYLLSISVMGFALMALMTIIESFRTIAPRFPKAPPSLAFFADIASLSREEYIRRVEAMTPDEALDQILQYNHTLAGICVVKFGRLRIAIHLCQAASGFWLSSIILIAIRMFF
jgi:hypothetical protein